MHTALNLFVHNLDDELGGEIHIEGDLVTHYDNSSRNVPGFISSKILKDKTREFMTNFTGQTLDQLDEQQIITLHNNSAIAAFTCLQKHDYRIVTKKQDLTALMDQLRSKTKRYTKAKQSYAKTDLKSNLE